MLGMTDSRGKRTVTLTFVTVAFLAETFVFVARGDASHLAAYGSAILLTLGPWLAREGMEKFKPRDEKGA